MGGLGRRLARLAPIAGVLATVLRNGPLRRVIVAFFLFCAVEMGAWTAILIYAYAATGPESVGIVAVAQLLPAAALAPILAALGDRYPRERVLLASYLGPALAMVVVAGAALAGGPPVLVYGGSLVATIALTLTRPTQSALLPALSETPAELTATNGLASIAEGIGVFAGPLLVGLIVAVASIGSAFAAAAVALFVGAALVRPLRPRSELLAMMDPAPVDRTIDPAAPIAGSSSDAEPEDDRSLRDPVAGLRAVAGDRDLSLIIAVLTARLVVYGAMEVLLVLVALDLLGIGEEGAGYLMAVLGVGTIVGGAATFGLVGRRRLAPWLAVGALLVGVALAIAGVASMVATMAILLGVVGIGLALLDVVGQTLLQRLTPDEVRARVFGVLEALLLLGEAIGSLAAVPLVALFGVSGAIVAVGVLVPVVALAGLPRYAAIDGRVDVPTAAIRALRRLTLFAPLPGPVLEAVARHLVPLRAPAGATVIREGDPGDRYYLIAAGRAAVSEGGVGRTEMGAGEGFGEIALLRGVPRTATVRAETDLELFALDRDEFLAAVTGDPRALAEAHRVAAARAG